MKGIKMSLAGMNLKLVSLALISFLVIAGCSKKNDSITGPSLSTLPSDITELQIVMADSSVTLSWVNPPPDSEYNYLEITFTPVVAGISQPVIVSKGLSIKTISGLTNGAQYTFKAPGPNSRLFLILKTG
jgi:hypothetical protein